MPKIPARTIVISVLAVCTLLALGMALRSCQSAQTAKTEAKLATGQAGAAIQSGSDAVQTIGNTQANEQVADKITQENGNAIDHAKGSDVVVDPAARAAGLRALCRRESYRRAHAACM